MTLDELKQMRRKKWHVDGSAVRTLDAGREFVESVGFCLLYPLHPPVLIPTFLGAFAGSDEGLPTWQHAYGDPRAAEATELMVRLLRERSAYEANLFGEANLLVASAIFPYFYGLVGDRNPRQIAKPGMRSEYSPLARDVFEVIRAKGPISKAQMRGVLRGEPSDAALDRALGELWSRLRITRVDYVPAEGAYWDGLFRWAPDAVREGIQLSVPEALSALISKYLDCVVAAEIAELEDFFSHLVSRSRVRDSINALLAAREYSLVHVDSRVMIQMTAHAEAMTEPASRSVPIVPREKRRRLQPQPKR
ncbi:MAG TPA: hypothetical protein VK466_18675 [Terriglobales bacterium]|nr:hypothetical protein [Terriglobales bacterium]